MYDEREESTCPPYHPCADNDDDVDPVQELLHERGREKRGVETPEECSGFLLNILKRARTRGCSWVIG
jgi:hypothetical protein